MDREIIALSDVPICTWKMLRWLNQNCISCQRNIFRIPSIPTACAFHSIVLNCQLNNNSNEFRRKCCHPNAENSFPCPHPFVTRTLIFRIFMAFIRFTDVIEWNQARNRIVIHPIRKGRRFRSWFSFVTRCSIHVQRPHIKYLLMNLLVILCLLSTQAIFLLFFLHKFL